MNEIYNKLPFDENEIDKQNYTISLLKICVSNSIINNVIAEKIRIGLDEAFKETAEQYTKRASSTISVKQAEKLYLSVLYQSDVYLLSFNNNFAAIKALTINPIEEILKYGRNMILQIHEQNKLIFKNAYKNRLLIPIYEYNYVMNRAFDEYVSGYSARFDARNACASIDYPLLGCPAYNMLSQGAVFINEYYTGIMLENEFCSYFSKDEIINILINYGKIYNAAYSELLFNITEVIVNNLLAGILINKPLFCISLDKHDCDDLIHEYSELCYEELLKKIKMSFSKMYRKIFRHSLYIYIEKYISQFSLEIFSRLKSHSIINYLVIQNNH